MVAICQGRMTLKARNDPWCRPISGHVLVGFDERSGVLELDSPEVELHWELACGRSIAWWCDDLGGFLGMAPVGQA
jgi:hypothetical protein